jgi:phosphomannomutase
MQPQLAVSGYRGIWGTTLTSDIARTYVQAFSLFLHKQNAKRIIIGRDARPSGTELVEIISQELQAQGFEVTIGGLLPTPTVLFLVREMKFDGAIIVTASHNPPEYNGLKFVTSRGMFTTEADVAEIKSYLGTSPDVQSPGTISVDETLGEKHVAHILEKIDRKLIASKNFKVVLDTINSAGCILGPKLLRELGCEVTVINGEPDGDFAHMPEPLAENLGQLAEKVKETKANIGFAQDPDADRLVVCDETGTIVFEEYTLSLAVQSVLENPNVTGSKDVVINMSTSRTNEDLAQAHGGKIFRTKVGEANVSEGILTHNAIIGGEGGGGVIYPTINACRDSLTGMALILELLARTDTKTSKLVAELPHYEMRKNKFPYAGELAPLYEKMKTAFPEGQVNELDGLRLDFADGAWVHLRPSNTEPIVRLMGEAKTAERIDSLMIEIKGLFQ